MPKGADMKIVSAPFFNYSSSMPAGCLPGSSFDIRRIVCPFLIIGRIICLIGILRCAHGNVFCLCAVTECARKLLDCPQVIVRAQHFQCALYSFAVDKGRIAAEHKGIALLVFAQKLNLMTIISRNLTHAKLFVVFGYIIVVC